MKPTNNLLIVTIVLFFVALLSNGCSHQRNIFDTEEEAHLARNLAEDVLNSPEPFNTLATWGMEEHPVTVVADEELAALIKENK